MTEEQSKFNRVLGRWDIIVMAFGAMIGWGWVVSSGGWIQSGGVIGAALGFVIGGVMVYFVGRTYAELTSAMPKCGGEHVFGYRAMGPAGSFLATWSIILGYLGVVCFESCTIPMIFAYIYPDFLQGYLYTIAGFDIYATWVISAFLIAVFMTYINIRGVKIAAIVQAIFTVVIMLVGILLIVGGVIMGDTSNLDGQMFLGDGSLAFKGILTVALITPFFFIGFDVIPQTAEEINVPFKKIGTIIIISIILAVIFYAGVIIAVGLLMDESQIAASMAGSGLVTADALGIAFNSTTMAKVVLVGGLCGILTSWNSFIMGGSRAMYAMGESNMIPRFFGKLHEGYKTPITALLFIGVLSMIAPFFGRPMLVWLVNAANFGCCLAYFIVALSFMILRKKEPDMERPYKVKHYKFVGIVAMLMSGFMVVAYMIPGTGSTLGWHEWIIVGGWMLLGGVFILYCKKKYGDEFARSGDLLVNKERS